jgi:hypothetical protein
MKTDWNSCPMQTHADLKLGSLVRWHGGGDPDAPEDIDELGIVIQRPGQNFSGNYHIAWSTSKSTSHHSPEMIEESLYQGQMEVLWNRK